MLTNTRIEVVKGSKILFETLKNLSVDTIFGYPGGIVLDIYDELYKQTDIKHILVRHEQSAVHAAEGYARTTGKCGVVLVTSGPGATNTVTGIANAYLDGSPLVVITGQVFSNLLGKNAFQEADICDITKSCTKKTFRVTEASQIQQTLQEAFQIATTGKKGPVVVDITKNALMDNCKNESITTNRQQLKQPQKYNFANIFNLISNAKMPIIVAGGGVIQAKAEDELLAVSQKFNMPVVNTMMGIGSYPQNSENYLGKIGIFGDNSANQIIKESDLIISLGARFNDRITCMFKDIDFSKKLIQIDTNEKEIANFIKPLEWAVCDIKIFLNELLYSNISLSLNNWLEKSQTYKNLNKPQTKSTNLLHSFEVIQEIENYTKNQDIIFTTEVGQHQLWAIKNLNLYKNRKILVSGGAGTMGFGLPAAIGAAIAKTNTPIVCISGDGSFQMGLQELATCKDYNLNVKIMIINNGYLGMVRQLQEKLCDAHYSETKISNPDFITLAKSYGINAIRVSKKEDIIPALVQAFATNKTFITEFIVEPMELL